MAKSDKKRSLKPKKPASKLQKLIMHYGWAADNIVARMRAVWPQFMHAAWVSGAAATALVAVVLGASFLKTESIDYSFARSSNCINNPLFLPELADVEGNNYETRFAGVRTVFGYPVFSARTCLEIEEPFLPGQSQELTMTHPLMPFGKKKVALGSPAPAKVFLGRPAALPVATSGALIFHLSEQDRAFNYALTASGRSVNCGKMDAALLCNLDNLNLKQDKEYVFSLARYFKGRPGGQAFQQKLATVEPIKIVESSINPNQKIQNAPEGITLNTNKRLKPHGDVVLELIGSDEITTVETSVEIQDKTLAIKFASPLKRRAEFKLTIDNLLAVDDAYQPSSYVLRFSTSGGPKVAGTNIGTYGVNRNQRIILTLDTEPKPDQNIAGYVNVSGGMNHSVSLNGKQITITPVGSWPRCNKFTVELKDGIQNKFGISGGSAWQLSSRTICQTISSIGTSVQGRTIYAHRFGNGSQTVMFVGGTHGNEASSVYILNSWIDFLESSYDAIPSNKTILVVPNVNPDGVTAGTRTNARDVDLNRNFPASNWKEDVIMPDGELNEAGGGSSPLSEPETKAIANYILTQNPQLVMNYHAVGSLVIGNGAEYADSIAESYASSVGYWLPSGGSVFEYDTTGAMTDWLSDKHGIPAVLIELSSYYGNEFWNHQSAMWTAAGS